MVLGLSEGNLMQKTMDKFSGKFNDVGMALNTSLDNLSSLILDTNVAVHNLTDSVEQIHQGSQDLNGRTQEQASFLEESSAAAESMRHEAQDLSELVRRFKISDKDASQVSLTLADKT